MVCRLPEDRMPEAEVSLRLAHAGLRGLRVRTPQSTYGSYRLNWNKNGS